MNGPGTAGNLDGEWYKGEFKNGYIHGQGTKLFEKERTYIGGFENGKRCGHGVETHADGEVCECTWNGFEWRELTSSGVPPRMTPTRARLLIGDSMARGKGFIVVAASMKDSG